MIEATLAMLRARHDEKVAVVGVICACFADDLDEAVRRMETARDAARECAERGDQRTGDRRARRIYRHVAAWADDLLPAIRQMAEREHA